MDNIFIWRREHYSRVGGDAWKRVPGSAETRFITEYWMSEKTGEGELAFWRSIDADVRVSERANGTIDFVNTSPNGRDQVRETFTPLSLHEAYQSAGYRELRALARSAMLTHLERVETSDPSDIVVRFGEDDQHADYDFSAQRWVA